MKTIDEVIKEYPNLFRKEGHCGYHCGQGWIPLVEKICHYIQWEQQKNKWLTLVNKTEQQVCDQVEGDLFNFKFDQIKEKFGTLRIYYSFWEAAGIDFTKFEEAGFHKEMVRRSAKINGYVDAMCAMSGMICEDTGQPGTQYSSQKGGGWIRTLSAERAKQLRYELLEEKHWARQT